MAEGDGPKPGEVLSAEALERFDAYIAKQKELLELRKQDSEFIKDNIDLLRIQQEQAKADLDVLAQKLDRELKLTQQRLEKLKLEKKIDKTLKEQLEKKVGDLEQDIKNNAADRAKAEDDLKNQKKIGQLCRRYCSKDGYASKIC